MVLLKTFAKECPGLKKLGLYFESSEPPTFDGWLDPADQFKEMTVLYVNSSWVPGEDFAAIGFFLASIFDSCPTIYCGRSQWVKQETPLDDADRAKEWAEVNKVIRMAFRAKDSIREHVNCKDLHDRIDKLQKC